MIVSLCYFADEKLDPSMVDYQNSTLTNITLQYMNNTFTGLTVGLSSIDLFTMCTVFTFTVFKYPHSYTHNLEYTNRLVRMYMNLIIIIGKYRIQ